MRRLATLVAVLLAFAAPKVLRAQVGPAGGNGLCNGVVSAGNPCKPATAGTADSAKALTSAAYPLLAPNGSSSAPSYAWTNATNSGLYYTGTQTCAVTAATLNFCLASDGSVRLPYAGTAAVPSLILTTNGTDGIYSDAVNTLKFATNATNALTLSATQTATFAGALLAPNGTAAAPSYSWTNDATSGLYRIGTNNLGVSINSSGVWQWQSTGYFTPVIDNAQAFGQQTLRITNAYVAAGTAAAPSLSVSFNNSTSRNGLYAPSADNLGITTNGVLATRFNANGSALAINGTAALPAWSFANDTITGLYRAGAGLLGFAGTLQSTTAQTTPGALSATQATLFPSTANGASLMGYGTTYDVTLFNRAGTAVLGIGPNNTLVTVPGNQTVSGNLGAGGGYNNTYTVYSYGQLRADGLITANAGITVASGTSAFQAVTATTGTFTGAIQTANGAVATPQYSFTSATNTGLYNLGSGGATDSIGVAVNGVSQMKIGAAGVLLLPVLPAEGATKNAMCWDAVTFNVTQNAAATCTVSALRFKTDVQPVSATEASRIVGRLRATSYREKSGGRAAFGIIADSAEVVDKRLASYDAKGIVTSTNYEEVTTLLLAKVQAQQAELDALRGLVCEEARHKGSKYCTAH